MALCHIQKKPKIQISGSSEWVYFPPLLLTHEAGTLNVVGDTPVVIGGKNQIGDVEIYDHTTENWVPGPSIDPNRNSHSTVVLNETSLVVVGGLDNSGAQLNSVKILNIVDRTWNDLPNFPNKRFGMPCGIRYDSNEIFCVGGYQARPVEFVSNTFSLNLSAIDESWKERPNFNIQIPALGGFLLLLGNHLYCMTITQTNFIYAPTLRRIDIDDPNGKFVLVNSDYAPNTYEVVVPFLTTGYVIGP